VLGVNPHNLDDALDATDFQEWLEYFQWKDTRRDKMDFYLAQLAGYASGKKRWRVSEFMVPTPGGGHMLTAEQGARIARATFGRRNG